MTDRELLELAAKAAGYDCRWHPDDPFALRHMHIAPNWMAWNPLDDDGDALRLAVKLTMLVDIPGPRESSRSIEVVAGKTKRGYVEAFEESQPDPYAATRSAIVRAAAEIGKAMP